jgi:hypothetical protein
MCSGLSFRDLQSRPCGYFLRHETDGGESHPFPIDVKRRPACRIVDYPHRSPSTLQGLPLTNTDRDVQLKADPPKYT